MSICSVDTEGKRKSAIDYFYMYQQMALQNKDYHHVNDASLKLAQVQGGEGEKLLSLTDLQKLYEKNQDDLDIGTRLARKLNEEKRIIQSERLLLELIEKSRRVHGRNHPQTDAIMSSYESVSERVVILINGPHRALRYGEDGDLLFVQGPLGDEKEKKEEKISSIQTADFKVYNTLLVQA